MLPLLLWLYARGAQLLLWLFLAALEVLFSPLTVLIPPTGGDHFIVGSSPLRVLAELIISSLGQVHSILGTSLISRSGSSGQLM